MSISLETSKETTVLSGSDSFMTVRHLAMRGTNFDIGKAIGRLAIDRYGRSLRDCVSDPIHTRARRLYFERNYPIHWERVRGIAEAFGADPEDDRYDLSNVMYRMDLPPGMFGCSVVYFPPATTASGSGCLSRNYDFSTGSIADVFGLPVAPEVKAKLRSLMGEPYIMEWYPTDAGYSSIAIQNFDLLSGTMDGMNSAGLAVSILADDEAIMLLGPRFEPQGGLPKAVGVHELQLMRMLLDTCATAEEAEDTLFGVKDFYTFAPLHYIVADRTGRSFIFENSTGRNAQFVFRGTGAPQFLTNFELYRHGSHGPDFDAPLAFETNAFWRYRKISDELGQRSAKFGFDDFVALSESVRAPELFIHLAKPPTNGGDLHASAVATNPLVRTLWHSIYDQDAQTARFSFYLGDATAGDAGLVARRTAYLTFHLGACDEGESPALSQK